MVIVIPQILSSIDNARLQSLNSEAKGIAQWWDKAIVADSLTTPDKWQVTDVIPQLNKGSWVCIYQLFDISVGEKQFMEYLCEGKTNCDM